MPRCDPTALLDLVEEPFDEITGSVEIGAEADWLIAVAFRRDIGRPRHRLLWRKTDIEWPAKPHTQSKMTQLNSGVTSFGVTSFGRGRGASTALRPMRGWTVTKQCLVARCGTLKCNTGGSETSEAAYACRAYGERFL